MNKEDNPLIQIADFLRGINAAAVSVSFDDKSNWLRLRFEKLDSLDRKIACTFKIVADQFPVMFEPTPREVTTSATALLEIIEALSGYDTRTMRLSARGRELLAGFARLFEKKFEEYLAKEAQEKT